ncbi:MAG: pyridoxal phosphate-dependent aminotransferase [Candidatus Liptonbacteria bacterium]|nr:pyridoxal phosphate-dependent aminotransferase [Candidatus Liptonbacteria bacterium]
MSLAQGIPYLESHALIRKAAIEALSKGKVDRYSLSAGIPELRELVALKWGLTSESEVLITAGAMEALSVICLALFGRGDEVITFSPYYSAYSRAVELCGAKLVSEELEEARGWRPNLQSLERKITGATRAILLCNPHNPTGMVFTRAELEAIGELALRRNLLIISDDVYRNFYYGPEKPYQLADDPRFRKNLINVVNCAPVISQYAALAALKFEDRILPDVFPQYARHRALMGKCLESFKNHMSFTWPEGSYYFFPKVKSAGESEVLCFDILRRNKVATVPGSTFGPGGEGHIRICFGRAEQDIVEGMARLTAYFESVSKA